MSTHDDRALFAVVFVEVEHGPEWKVADDVAVENEERLRVLAQHVASQSQWTSCNGTEPSEVTRSALHTLHSEASSLGNSLSCCGEIIPMVQNKPFSFVG